MKAGRMAGTERILVSRYCCICITEVRSAGEPILIRL